jgi:hypothetical protein
MPASTLAEKRVVQVPYSEAACASGVAGQTLYAFEEDCYYNGKMIPKMYRTGCYILTKKGNRIPLLKSEAGWRDD